MDKVEIFVCCAGGEVEGSLSEAKGGDKVAEKRASVSRWDEQRNAGAEWGEADHP